MMLPSVILLVLFTLIQLTDQMTSPCNHNVSCGCSVKSWIHSKIVGGKIVTSRTWSWVVSIRIRNKFRCAGSILSNSWILTAAHCFSIVDDLGINIFQVDASDITVHAGSNNQHEESQLRRVANVILHPQFDELSNFINDIALLKLSSPLHMTDLTLAKICLPDTILDEYPAVDSSLVAIGWGRVWENGPQSSILQQVTLKAIDYQNHTCYPWISDQSKQFCAGVENSKKDTCQGDSGGPLMMFTSSKQWVIAGITSSGYGCARPGYSGVYTRVISYLDWIKLFIDETDNSMYPLSLTFDIPSEDNDTDWIVNSISSYHSISFSLCNLITMLNFLQYEI